MNRRDFLFMTVASVVLLSRGAAAATDDRPGTLQNGMFSWTNGGGSPYKGTLAKAMELAGVPQEMRSRIEEEVAAHPQGNAASYTLPDGYKVGSMVFTSKGHWISKETVAMPSKWKSSASREALVWYIDIPEGGQIRVIKPLVCGNWSFKTFAAPALCPRCEPEKGDAC